MKIADYHWDHPELKHLKKRADEGHVLFRQGEEGKTMLIIVQGIVYLLAESEGKELIVGFVGAGEFLGEKAVISGGMHKRVFGGVAKTKLIYMELGLDDIELIEKKNPALMEDILKHMFQLAARRLDQSNYLSKTLRSSSNVKRLVNLVWYFAICTGSRSSKGIEFFLTVDQVRFYIDMNKFEIEECFKELESRSILIPQGNDLYLITSKDALLGSINLLREAIPSITAI